MLVDTIVTFEKDLAPGVRVLIDGVPAKVRSGPNPERLYDRKTAARLEELLRVARERMGKGENPIQLRFEDDAENPEPLEEFGREDQRSIAKTTPP